MTVGGSPMKSFTGLAKPSCWRCRLAWARPITSPTRSIQRRVAVNSIKLTIFTGLTLGPPRARNELERRFLEPLAERVFAGYPALDYATAIQARTVPPNVTINEFFFMAGQWLDSPYAQQHYISANY